MILAAGFGTRLRPLTDKVPKPLLPVANRPLIEYTFALLASAGVEEVVVNAHHLADEMEEGIHRARLPGLEARVSRERAILGTAGGPRKAAPFLQGGTFLLLNGDFLVDMDLREAVAFHRAAGARATMVLRPDGEGGIFIEPSGRIRRFLEPGRESPPQWTRCGFTGVHVLEPEVLDLIPAGMPWEINRQVYPEMLSRRWPVFGFLHRGYWREAGSPPGYLAANLEVVGGRAGALAPRASSGALNPPGEGMRPPLLLGPGADVEAGAVLGPGAVVGPRCRIGGGALVRRAVILAGTAVPGRAAVENQVRGPGVVLPVPGLDPFPGASTAPPSGKATGK